MPYPHPAEGPQVSVVVPAYNEEGNIRKLCAELVKVLSALHMSWEIVFCDDGSTDETWQEITALHQQDGRAKGIRLSRNFGHQCALWAGLSQASGELVITMDADLQHPPAIIPQLVQERQKGNKIVHTSRLDPQSVSRFKRVTSKLFYRIFSALCGVKLECGMADFRLMDRQVVDSILRFREQGVFLRGMVQWVGFPSSTVTFQCQDRYSGISKYTLKKMIKLALGGVTSYSLVPLRVSILVGVVTGLAALGEMVYAICVKLFTHTAVPGWASAVGVVSFLFGVLFILLGVIGEYIGRILLEVKCRPRFLVSAQVGLEAISQDKLLPLADARWIDADWDGSDIRARNEGQIPSSRSSRRPLRCIDERA